MHPYSFISTKEETSSEPTEARVRGIIINELGVEPEKVTNDASFVEDLGADSLGGIL